MKKYDAEEKFVTEINIYEIVRGLAYHAKKHKTNKNKLDLFLNFLDSVQIIPSISFFSWEAGEISAELKLAGKPIESQDCLIAGYMRRVGCDKIITKNVKHFSKIKGIKAIGY